MGSIYVNLRTGAIRYRRRKQDRKPQWWTPERGAALAKIMGSVGATRRFAEAFDLVEDICRKWATEQRERDLDLWHLEQNQIHGEKGVFGRQFDPVEREVFLATRPSYYLVGQGVDVLAGHKPVTQIRIPSTHINLFVHTPPAPKLGKNARKRLARRQSQEVPGDVDTMLREAVAQWWERTPR